MLGHLATRRPFPPSPRHAPAASSVASPPSSSPRRLPATFSPSSRLFSLSAQGAQEGRDPLFFKARDLPSPPAGLPRAPQIAPATAPWSSWELGAWKPLGINGRQRARLRKEVLLAGEDWTYDPPRGEMRTKRKGHKVDRIAAEKRANTVELMKKMPQMLLDYKKRRWDKKMKEEEAAAAKAT